MSTRELMSRARELLHQHAGATALVIVPLAMAVPAVAASVFTYNDDPNNPSFISSGSIGISGGVLFGNINGAVGVPNDASVRLTGNTKPPALNTSGQQDVFLPASLAVTHVADPLNNGNPLPTVQFHWTGGFSSPDIVTANAPFLLSYSVGLQGFLVDSQGGSFGDVSWVLQAVVNDSSGNPIVWDSASGSAFQTGLTDHLTGTNVALTSGGPLIFNPGGAENSWTVDLILLWDNLAADGVSPIHPDDQLSVTPSIDLFSPASSGAAPVPLPSAFGMGGLLLSMAGVSCVGKRLVRRMARTN